VHNEIIKTSSGELPATNAMPSVAGSVPNPWPWKSEKGRDTEKVTVNFGDVILPIKTVSVKFSEYPKAFNILA